MSNPHAAHYADQLVQVETPLVRNDLIARDTYLCRVEAPVIAQTCLPGQFVMIRMAGHDAPLIGRAFAVWDVIDDDDGQPAFVDLIYLRKGTLTRALSAAPVGSSVVLWGPLGNGFDQRECDRLIMTAGGIGQTPMLMLGKSAMAGWAKQVEIIYGARTAELHAGVDQFREAGFDVGLCSDDGSVGTSGRVPDVLAERLDQVDPSERIRVVTCGPEIMMQKVAEVCASRSIDCQVSMETPMACGIGICFSCVAKIHQPDESDPPWDYKRTCVEGPIFDAEKICWDE